MQAHRIHVLQLKEEFKQREQDLIKEQQNMNSHFDAYKQNISKEMEIKEALLKRYIKYVDVLKKQIVLTKNVVKNPDLMKNALRTLNYTDLELYRLKHEKSWELLNSGLEEEAYNIKQARKASLVLRLNDKER